jgi:hypothetical protein
MPGNMEMRLLPARDVLESGRPTLRGLEMRVQGGTGKATTTSIVGQKSDHGEPGKTAMVRNALSKQMVRAATVLGATTAAAAGAGRRKQ